MNTRHPIEELPVYESYVIHEGKINEAKPGTRYPNSTLPWGRT